MVLNIIALLLILGITFFQTTFGLFSGMINVMCTISAVCIAFGCFEPLNDLMVRSLGWHPSYTLSASFVLLFVVSLIILRTLADNFIRGNVRFPQAVDFGGAAICAFINAQCCVGVMVLSLMMLPFGGRVFMFQRYERLEESSEEKFKRNSIWLKSDEFTVGLFKMLSSGSMSGSTTFASIYPNFSEWVSLSAYTVQAESLPAPLRDKGDGHKDLKVQKWWEQTAPVAARFREKTPTKMDPDPKYASLNQAPAAGNKFIAVQVDLSSASADRDKSGVHHRFRPGQFRVVGDESGKATQYIPKVISGADRIIGGLPRVVEYDNNFTVPFEDTAKMDIYFEVPNDFQPRFVEYRRFARTNLTPDAQSKEPEPRPLLILTPAQEQIQQQVGQMGFIAMVTEAGERGDTPFRLASEVVRTQDVSINGDQLVSGRLWGRRADIESKGSPTEIRRFKTPDGARLLQVAFRPRSAETLAGNVFNFVAFNINQYYAVDTQGGRHPLIGYYALIKRNGEDYVELRMSNPGDADFRQMLDFKNVTRNDLTGPDEAIVGLIFQVAPGKQINKISNQTGAGVEVNPPWSISAAAPPGGGG
ncbi:MAG: hypothetical protein JNG88_05545 [Phycisphaerales bacterium]|nr:hypothetical protein [Phycisphaerales bacterium]